MIGLPHSIEAEQSLLGALLFDNTTFHKIIELDGHFYDPAHGRIYATIAKMVRAGRLADGVTLHRQMEMDVGLKEIGGASYLLTLLESAAKLTAHAREYARMIRDLSVRRNIITTCRDAAIQAANPPEDATADSILSDALSAFDGLAEHAAPSGWRSLSSVMQASVESARLGQMRGVSTGIAELDARINGLRAETFVVLGGRVKMGKTLVGMSIARAVADQSPDPSAPKYGVAIFSLEMDEDQIGLREASDLAFAGRPSYSGKQQDPSYFDAMRNDLDDQQWRWLEDASKSKPDWNVEIDFTPSLTPSQIESRCRRLFRRWRARGVTPFLVMIDHMGKVRPDRQNAARSAERADVVDDLDALKKKLGVCIVGLSQINRAGDTEERPNNTHLEWSDRIAANAQAVLLIYREEYYLLRKPELSLEETDRLKSVRNKMELIVDIVRGGTSGTVIARVNLPTASLRNLD